MTSSCITPTREADNPEGADQQVFDGIVAGVNHDRFDFLTAFGKQFFGVDLLNHTVSDATLNWMQSICQTASPHATEQCVYAFSATP